MAAALPVLFVLGAGLALLAVPGPPPAQDWPQHVATAHVLAAQLMGGVQAAPGYAAALQPVPYHLLWALLVPCIVVFGTACGSAVCLCGLFLATAWTCSDAARRLGRSPWCTAVALPAFFGANFAWGFAPTWAGLPPYVYCLGLGAQALRAGEAGGAARTRRAAARLALGAAAACAAHVVWVPAVLLLAASLIAAAPRHRAAWRAAVALGGGAAACLLPWATQLRSVGPQISHLRWESLAGALDHWHSALGCFERGPGRAAQATLLVALTWRVMHGVVHGRGGAARPRAADEVALGYAGAGLLALMWATPLEIVSPDGISWLLGIRLQPAASVAWMLAPAPAPAPPPASMRRLSSRPRSPWWPSDAALVLATAACFVYVFGIAPVAVAHGRAAAAVRALGRRVPAGAWVAAEVQPVAFGRAWPPLLRHLSLWSYADGAAYVEGLFQGGHLPLRAAGGCRVRPHDAEGRLTLGRCTHVWLAVPPDVLARRAPEAVGLVLLGEAAGYRLYGPVRSAHR